MGIIYTTLLNQIREKFHVHVIFNPKDLESILFFINTDQRLFNLILCVLSSRMSDSHSILNLRYHQHYTENNHEKNNI